MLKVKDSIQPVGLAVSKAHCAISFADFKEHFEVPQSLVDVIIAEGEKQNIKPKDEAELQKTISYLRVQLKALIARDIWDMSEYFSVFNESSDVVKKALEVISR